MNSLVSGRHDKKNAHSFNLVSTLWPSCLPNTIQRPKVRYIVRPFLSHRIVFSFLNIHESYQWSSMRFEVDSFLINYTFWSITHSGHVWESLLDLRSWEYISIQDNNASFTLRNPAGQCLGKTEFIGDQTENRTGVLLFELTRAISMKS